VGLGAFEQLQGKELSHNNLMDADAAWRLVHDLPSKGVAIVKHAGPCGVGLGHHAASAYDLALACDPVSAFGGVIASALPIDEDAAGRMTELFAEVIVASEVSEDARRVFAAKKNLRVLIAPPPSAGQPRVRVVDGGLLVQSADEGWQEDWRVVTARPPHPAERSALALAWRVAKHVASNAIVIANQRATVASAAASPAGWIRAASRSRRRPPRSSHWPAPPPEVMPSSPFPTAWSCLPAMASPRWRSRVDPCATRR